MKIHATAVVDKNARLGEAVEIGPYSVVGLQVTLGRHTRVLNHVVLDGHTSIGERCLIHLSNAVHRVRKEFNLNKDLRHLLAFVENSERGIARNVPESTEESL